MLRLRYLLAGLGNIGTKRRAILGGRCVGAVDPVHPAAEFTDPAQCPAGRYDAAILAVPNPEKLALLEYFLSRGKHVLVEKPLLFACDETAGRMNRLAREKGAIWHTGYNHRFEPQVAALKARLDSADVGRIYSGRLFYGNGTVRNMIGSWREEGLGVLEDLGCHLIDLMGHLFGYAKADFRVWALEAVEAKNTDRCILATPDHRFELECSMLCWKNTFSIDVYGEKGSLHVNGLCKWGDSELIFRERVFPSGVPIEFRSVVKGPDLTWEKDLQHFETQVDKGETSGENDARISSAIRTIAADCRPA